MHRKLKRGQKGARGGETKIQRRQDRRKVEGVMASRIQGSGRREKEQKNEVKGSMKKNEERSGGNGGIMK